MEHLTKIQGFIEKHADTTPEGEYLELCNATRDLFRCKTDSYVFNHEYQVIEDGEYEDKTSEYFNILYKEKMRNYERKVLNNYAYMLECELRELQELKRITKSIKSKVVKHYCRIHNIRLEEYTPECLKKEQEEAGYCFPDYKNFEGGFNNLCKSYMGIHNKFMEECSEKLSDKIDDLYDQMDRIH